MENRSITIELKDETAKIIGGTLAIGLGTSLFAPRWIPNPDVLFYPYQDGVRVRAILELIPAHDWVVFDGDARYGRAILRSWGDDFLDPIVGDPFAGLRGWLVPIVDGEPLRTANLGTALDRECAFLVRGQERIHRVA